MRYVGRPLPTYSLHCYPQTFHSAPIYDSLHTVYILFQTSELKHFEMPKVGLDLNSAICGCQAEAITSRNLWLPNGFGSIWSFNAACRRVLCHPDAPEVLCRWSLQPTRMEKTCQRLRGVRCCHFFCFITAVEPNKIVSTEMWNIELFSLFGFSFHSLPSKQQNTMLHDSYLSAEVFSAFLSRRDGFLCKHLSMIAILFPQQVKFSFENAFSREANR